MGRPGVKSSEQSPSAGVATALAGTAGNDNLPAAGRKSLPTRSIYAASAGNEKSTRVSAHIPIGGNQQTRRAERTGKSDENSRVPPPFITRRTRMRAQGSLRHGRPPFNVDNYWGLQTAIVILRTSHQPSTSRRKSQLPAEGGATIMGSGGPNQAICRKEAENGGGVWGVVSPKSRRRVKRTASPSFAGRACLPWRRAGASLPDVMQLLGPWPVPRDKVDAVDRVTRATTRTRREPSAASLPGRTGASQGFR